MAEPEKRRDLTAGVPVEDFRNSGLVAGRVGDNDVIVVHRDATYVALGAKCTHYQGPLAEGLVLGDTIRCPWHHACFSLTTGEALRAPALDPLPCWRVDFDGRQVFVRGKIVPARRRRFSDSRASWPESIVIIGGGAAGLAAAVTLRREGYDRPVTMLSADPSPPPDRPNLSKDYLAGRAPADWIPLREDVFYRDQEIDLRLDTVVESIDVAQRVLHFNNRPGRRYGALLLATGASPVRLNVPGSQLPHVHYLRTLADSDAIIRATAKARRAAVIGASFIGLEVAAAFRARGVDVQVIAPETYPLERVLGEALGKWIRRVHESQGVVFHLGRGVTRIDRGHVMLSDGTVLEADLVVVGIGVRPSVDLAERAGLRVDRGVQVNEQLETSAPGIYAAGDVARWPDARTGAPVRVEHWVVAERMGQTAARNMLGARETFDSAPFFWSQHYDTSINYVGHAESWDAADVEGSLDDNDCAITFRLDGRPQALATIGRDRQSLEFEAELEGALSPAT